MGLQLDRLKVGPKVTPVENHCTEKWFSNCVSALVILRLPQVILRVIYNFRLSNISLNLCFTF